MATLYWTCDFCGHQEESKVEIDKHEEHCDLNPNNILDIDDDPEDENEFINFGGITQY